MASLNKVQLIGNLGKDPVIKHAQSGATIANFSIATGESYTDKQGRTVDKTEWHNVVAFNKIAEVCEKYLGRGKQVYIEGRLQTRKWQDKQGTDRWTTEVLADRLLMLGKKENGDGHSNGGPDFPNAPDEESDETPF